MIATFALAAGAMALAVSFRVPFVRSIVPDPGESDFLHVMSWFLYHSPWMRIWDFAIGILLAQFVAVAGEAGVRRLSRPPVHGIALVLLTVVFVGATTIDLGWPNAVANGLYQSCGFTPWIGLVLLTGYYRADLYRRNILRPVGTVSYSIYLDHYVIFGLLLGWVAGPVPVQPWLIRVGHFTGLLLISGTFFFLTYFVLELPFVRLGRKIALTRPPLYT